MYELEYLPSAVRDMVDIVTYNGKTLDNPMAAKRLSKEFVDGAESIRDFPYSLPVYIPIRPLKREYRKIIVKNYIMFYWVSEQEKRITIARVMYAKSDYGKGLE